VTDKNKIKNLFEFAQIDFSWSFSEKTRKDTTYLTHGYHHYPAKFIPQIVSRIVSKYTKKGDLVADTFCGCGTTLVESKIMGRKSIGVDINPVAILIAKSKITPIEPVKLSRYFIDLKFSLDSYSDSLEISLPKYDRIDYWFLENEKKKLAFILSKIVKIDDLQIKNFFLCAFSNILKGCSIWMQKSNKPTRDLSKIPYDPFLSFFKQIKSMISGNLEFFNLLKEKNFLDIESELFCSDARNFPAKDCSVDLIVTSPPYVTSYEYADLHQLSILWLDYAEDLFQFRKKFIGSSYHSNDKIFLNSFIAQEIIDDLLKKDKKTAEEVSIYFSEMNEVFLEMKRILKVGGKTAIVVGNTSLKGVEILNAEVFTEQLENLGFKIVEIIKREIPSKNLPSIRDEKTGKFAKLTDENKVFVYPTEFILIMEKL